MGENAATLLRRLSYEVQRFRFSPEDAAEHIYHAVCTSERDVFEEALTLLPEVTAERRDFAQNEDEMRVAVQRAYERLIADKAALDEVLAADIAPEEKASQLIKVLLEFLERGEHYNYRITPRSRHVRALSEQPSEVRQALIAQLLVKIRALQNTPEGQRAAQYNSHEYPLKSVLEALVEAEEPLSGLAEQSFLDWAGSSYALPTHQMDAFPALRVIRRRLEASQPLPEDVIAMLRRSLAEYGNGYWLGDLKPFVKALQEPLLNPGEAWADAVTKAIREDAAWRGVVAHALTATSAKPSEAWQRKGKEVLAKVVRSKRVLEFLALVGAPRTRPLDNPPFARGDVNLLFDKYNANAARGLAWLAAGLDTNPQESARVLAHLSETSLKKVPGVGPRDPKLANAGVVALARLDADAAVAQLARLKNRVTFKTTLKQIEAALALAAERAGVSQDELEEMSVPDFGLDKNGVYTERFTEAGGEARAELTLKGSEVRLEYFNVAGKPVKAPPKAVKERYADDLKALKATVKDLKQTLATTAHRLETSYLSQKRWAYPVWRERYLAQPVVASVARRLIWVFSWDEGNTSVYALPYGDSFVNAHGEHLKIPEHAEVHLWHPLESSVDEILAWRTRLETHEIRQPWKQAHREVYLLTDAERATETYSNRFAAHILKQHQFNQLCALRGWANRLRLMVDDEYPPATLELPAWGLRAEYWIEGVGDDYGVDTTEAGSYLRLTTDQVRFHRLGDAQNTAHAGGGGYRPSWRFPIAAQPLALADVPPLVFSEVMRDVDLFVGVSSVGNDPTWQDGGPEGRFRDYWHAYSFGDLEESAKSRKEVLTQLLPRLKIRDRAHIEGRFLKVRGDLRSYKIHLGSSNILMEPNDQYLCIVPDARLNKRGANVFLPFEGDRTLSLILSKAFLLAEDKTIKDEIINRQIRE